MTQLAETIRTTRDMAAEASEARTLRALSRYRYALQIRYEGGDWITISKSPNVALFAGMLDMLEDSRLRCDKRILDRNTIIHEVAA